MKLALLALALSLAGCTSVTWATPDQIAPYGPGEGTKSRVVTTAPDGTKTYVLVLAANDDVQSALLTFVKKEHVAAAHFTAIGGVKEPVVGWFDPARKQYKLMALDEQVEVLTLSGDVALSSKGDPVVHSHAVFGRPNGEAWGGHVVKATVAPMLEVFLTAYPEPLRKVPDSTFGIERIEPQ